MINVALLAKSPYDVWLPLENAVRDYMADGKIPGMAVAVTLDGKIVFEKGFGTADRATGKPFKANTRCRIGSISKSFTAVGIACLMIPIGTESPCATALRLRPASKTILAATQPASRPI